MMRPLFLALLVSLAVTGCYRSHERAREDAGSIRDASRDAPSIDAPTPITRCDELFVSHSLSLGDSASGAVTPRLAVLPGADLALVHVSTDGAPTRVTYRRLSATLEPLSGPTTIVSDAFTWAEVTWTGEAVAVGYGRTAAEPSELSLLTIDGARLSASALRAEHPSLLEPLGDGLVWIAFSMREENALTIDLVDPSGGALRPTQRIETGRYGSGHGMALDDGSALLGYSREGPPGVRQVYVRRIDRDGALGTELQLSSRGDRFAIPASRPGESVVVYGGNGVLGVADIDPLGMVASPREEHAIEAFGVVAAFAGDRLLVATFGGEGLVLRDLGRGDDEGFTTLSIPMPLGGAPQFGDMVALPNAAVLAVHVVRGADTFPVLLRLECRAAD